MHMHTRIPTRVLSACVQHVPLTDSCAGPCPTTSGRYCEEALCGLDWLVAECARRGLRLLLALTNYWADYGGIPQYVRSGQVRWCCDTKLPYCRTLEAGQQQAGKGSAPVHAQRPGTCRPPASWRAPGATWILTAMPAMGLMLCRTLPPMRACAHAHAPGLPSSFLPTLGLTCCTAHCTCTRMRAASRWCHNIPSQQEHDVVLHPPEEFYTNVRAQELFRGYVRHLLCRSNTVTGGRTAPHAVGGTCLAWPCMPSLPSKLRVDAS